MDVWETTSRVDHVDTLCIVASSSVLLPLAQPVHDSLDLIWRSFGPVPTTRTPRCFHKRDRICRPPQPLVPQPLCIPGSQMPSCVTLGFRALFCLATHGGRPTLSYNSRSDTPAILATMKRLDISTVPHLHRRSAQASDDQPLFRPS